MTFEHDAVIVTLAARASLQVREGIAALSAGCLLESQVFLNAAAATMQSLVVLLESPPPPKPMRKLAICGPAPSEDADIQPWMAQKFGGPDDGNAA